MGDLGGYVGLARFGRKYKRANIVKKMYWGEANRYLKGI